MCADTPVLSNVWWPIKTPNKAWDKALAIYLNSSVGIPGVAIDTEHYGRELD